MEYREQLKEAEASLVKDRLAVENMFNMAKAFDVKISSEDSQAFSDLMTASGAYTDSMVGSTAFVEDRLPEMCRQLDTSLLRANDSLKSLGESMSAGIFVDAKQAPESVLRELKAVHGKFDSLKSLVETYSRWQILFGQLTELPKEQPRLASTQKLVEAQTNLWKGLHNWDTRYLAWTTSPFSSVDVEELSREVQASTKQSYGFDKSIANEVSALYKSKVQGFRGFIPKCIVPGPT
jgi:hypothetical protein